MAVLYQSGPLTACCLVIWCSIGRKKQRLPLLVIIDREKADDELSAVLTHKVTELMDACGYTASREQLWATLDTPSDQVRPPPLLLPPP